MAKIGILGGSFDPVHIGHLLIAQQAMESTGLDRVVFIPASQAPLKPKTPLAENHHRLTMLELAVKNRKNFSVLDIELHEGGVSYSFATAQKLKKIYPQDDFFWILGADHLPRLNQWKNIETLCHLVTFIVMSRPRCSCDLPDIPGFRAQVTPARLWDVSSTEIRERIAKKLPIDLFLTENVANYIEIHKLYCIC